MQIKKGNTATLNILVKDTAGNIITNLADTTEILFAVKANRTDDDAEALIMKKKTLGEITIDSPSLGYLTIFLASEDTEIDVESYYIAVQLQYTPERKIELNLKDNATNQYTNKIKITQDIIRG